MNTSNSKSMDEPEQQNKPNIKKIKYKLKKASAVLNIDIEKFEHRININCSYDFLLKKFGQVGFLHEDNVPYTIIWIIDVKTSNNLNYCVIIYGKQKTTSDCEITDEIKNNTIWGICAPNDYEFLDYNKLDKLLGFEYSNYLKHQEKLKKKKEQDMEKKTKGKSKYLHNPNTSSEPNISYNKYKSDDKKFIDIDKFKTLDNEKLKEFTDDELACVLFTRFKESGSFLLKEALIIHRALEDQANYNIPYNKVYGITSDRPYNKVYNTKSDGIASDGTPNKVHNIKSDGTLNKTDNTLCNIPNDKVHSINLKKSNYRTNMTIGDNIDNRINKSKYNNKKDKTKYNNKK